MQRLLSICLALFLCAACQEPQYNPKDIESCNSQCTIDTDCIVLSDTCFLTAANKDDTQCFWDAHEKFMSRFGKSIKCPSPRPSSDYKAICVQNQCMVQDLNDSPKRDVSQNDQGKDIALPIVTIKPNILPFYVDSKWQFADYRAPAIETLGPDYQAGDKPFIAFDGRGNMWGQDGTIWFHRTYEFDENSITFAPHPDTLCNPDKCFDRLKDKPKPDNEMEQTRFLGRYALRYEEGYLAIENANEKVELNRYEEEAALPPLPQDLPLCQIRGMAAGETFPDYQPAVFDDIGYRVIGSPQTLYWDHHIGPQGYVELGDGQEVLFEGSDGSKILRRLTPYNTKASFGPQGLYCISGGYDRYWPRFMTEEQFEISDLSDDVQKAIAAGKLIQGNYCVQIEDTKGQAFSPIFSDNANAGYDDFGFYFKTKDQVYRIGDTIDFALKALPVSKDTFKGFAQNSCPAPLILLGE